MISPDAMAYSLQWYPHLVHFRYHGQVTRDDLLASNDHVYSDPRFDALRWQIVSFDPDCTYAADLDVVQRIAWMDRGAFRSNPQVRVLLVGNLPVQEKIYAAYAAVAHPEGWPVLGCNSLEEAFALTEMPFPPSGV